MSDAKDTKRRIDPAYRLPPGNAFANAWKISAVVGVLGLAAAGLGYGTNARRFAFSYLFAFLVFLTIALGSIFFTLIQHLTSAGWSVTVRRTSEFFGRGIAIFALLFVPVWLSMGQLYPWLHENAGSREGPHAAEIERTTPSHRADFATPGTKVEERRHGDAHVGQRGDPDELIEERVLHGKSPYLNLEAFTLRAVFYFVVWAVLGLALFGYSTKQDATKDPQLTVRAKRFSPPALIIFGLTLTFAAFDWIMSMQPLWYSTIFGVYIFAGSVVAIHATLIVTTMALRSTGILEKAINVEHYHDLGKLLFGFLVFWAYIGFSQFMLIWYAALPEEVTFFHLRWDDGPWKFVSLALVILHFVVPFLLLLSRNTKRRMTSLAVGAVWLIMMHALDIYWLVMPNYGQAEFSVHWLDAACFFGVGGTYLAVVFYGMIGHSLIPIGDPRLPRSLQFENA